MGYWDDGHMDDGWGLAMLFGMLGFGVVIAVALGFAVLWMAHSARAPADNALSPSRTRLVRRCTAAERNRSWPSDWRVARSTPRSTGPGLRPCGLGASTDCAHSSTTRERIAADPDAAPIDPSITAGRCR